MKGNKNNLAAAPSCGKKVVFKLQILHWLFTALIRPKITSGLMASGGKGIQISVLGHHQV